MNQMAAKDSRIMHDARRSKSRNGTIIGESSIEFDFFRLACAVVELADALQAAEVA